MQSKSLGTPRGVFVYGTLKQGERNHHWAQQKLSVEQATTCGTLYHLRYGYPAVLPGGDGVVHGEFLRFADLKAAVRRMDELEGYDPRHLSRSLYRRIPMTVTLTSGRQETAWGYVFPNEKKVRRASGLPIPCGTWKGSRIQSYTIRAQRAKERGTPSR